MWLDVINLNCIEFNGIQKYSFLFLFLFILLIYLCARNALTQVLNCTLFMQFLHVSIDVNQKGSSQISSSNLELGIRFTLSLE
jgi:hypothetical protein